MRNLAGLRLASAHRQLQHRHRIKELYAILRASGKVATKPRLSQLSGFSIHQVNRYLSVLRKERKVVVHRRGGRTYWGAL